MSDEKPENEQADRRWQGFEEIDRAIAENCVTAYSWKKTWADPWARAKLIIVLALLLAFIVFVVIDEGIL